MTDERYELVGPLGTGGMAEVLLARRVGAGGIERLLAVKRILPERAHDPDLVRMLLDEARNVASLVHHRIVQVFDVEIRDGVVLYAMEYLHGRTLEDVLARQPKLPLGAALAIAIAVADGLHHAHTRASPIVHRDIAPSNVMITYDGGVKLIDFGIAKAAGNLSNTVYGTFKGRLGYSSPEQCRCEPVDARTDIYSLAILLYEMTTGARAFTAASEQAMLDRMTAARIAPPASIDPQYPPALAAIVGKGFAPDRVQRYATAREMQEELEAFARSHGVSVSESALARTMHELFAEELVTWIRARDAGSTIEHHVLQQARAAAAGASTGARTIMHRDSTSAQADHATYVLQRRRSSSHRPLWLLPVAIATTILVVAYAITRWLLVR